MLRIVCRTKSLIAILLASALAGCAHVPGPEREDLLGLQRPLLDTNCSEQQPATCLRCRSTARLDVLVAGVAIAGVGYFGTAAFGVRLGSYSSTIPVIGPLFHLQDGSDVYSRAANAILLGGLIVQATGVGLIANAIFYRTRKPVLVQPVVLPGGGGISGTFSF